jgi:hypothetical protein
MVTLRKKRRVFLIGRHRLVTAALAVVLAGEPKRVASGAATGA